MIGFLLEVNAMAGGPTGQAGITRDLNGFGTTTATAFCTNGPRWRSYSRPRPPGSTTGLRGGAPEHGLRRAIVADMGVGRGPPRSPVGGAFVTPDVELVLDAHADLGEGPSWDVVARWLIWLDIKADLLDEGNVLVGPAPDCLSEAAWVNPLGAVAERLCKAVGRLEDVGEAASFAC
jgi:hypothetical protein